MGNVRWLGLCGTLVVLVACSSSSSPVASGSDASVADAQVDDAASGSVDAGTDTGGACHSVVNATAGVMEEIISGDPPAATGGAIADGRYVFSHLRTYVGDGGATAAAGTIRAAWQISGTTLSRVRRDDPDTVDHKDTLTMVVSGTTFTTTPVCQDATKQFSNPAGTYSVNGSDLVVFYPPSGSTTTSVTFTKQ